MARFMGSVQGQAGEATRLGSPKSGLRVKANGWKLGIEVRASVSPDGKDEFMVYRTGGSMGSGERILVYSAIGEEAGG